MELTEQLTGIIGRQAEIIQKLYSGLAQHTAADTLENEMLALQQEASDVLA